MKIEKLLWHKYLLCIYLIVLVISDHLKTLLPLLYTLIVNCLHLIVFYVFF